MVKNAQETFNLSEWFHPSGRLKSEFQFCKMCLGALENADTEEVISKICEWVKEENFEFDDFKIAFYISPILVIRKLYYFSLIDSIME